MDALSLDQVRTLEAVARTGSAARAAAELGRVASAVLYQMKQLEDAVGVPVFDRSGYRTGLTPFGRELLAHCRPLLQQLGRIGRFCEAARLGHEPSLVVVFDGLLPVGPLLAGVRAVAAASPETRVSLFSAFLGEVEERAHRDAADLALTVVPFDRPLGASEALPALSSVLVAAATHPLAGLGEALTLDDLGASTLLTVRGSDPRLGMLPAGFRPAAELRLSDFAAKGEALLAGMGWGWMPEDRVRSDLDTGRLVHLRVHGGPADLEQGRHVFTPTLHRHRDNPSGRAATAFIEGLRGRGHGPV